ncbi:tc5 transposase [Cooperia oncophora]
MSFSPARVIGRLLSSFTPDFSPPTRKEIAIADAFKGILQSAANGDIECEEEEESLQVHFDEESEVDWTPHDDDDNGRCSDVLPDQKCVLFDGKPIPEDMIKRAIEFYRETDKGSRPLSAMMNRFRWIKREHHINILREIEKKGILETSLDGIPLQTPICRIQRH